MRILFILLLLCSVCRAGEIVKVFRPLSTTYLMFRSSLTADDCQKIKTVLIDNSKTHWQPCAKFSAISNSTNSPFISFDWRDTEAKIDNSTTRILITLDSTIEKTSYVQGLLASGKIMKISEVWEKIYDDTRIGGKNLYAVEYLRYVDYLPIKTNKDFWIYDIEVSSK